MTGIHQMLLGGGEPTVSALIAVTAVGFVNPGSSSTAIYRFMDPPGDEDLSPGSIVKSNFSAPYEIVQYWLPGSTIAQRQQYEVRGTVTYFSNPAYSVVINSSVPGAWAQLGDGTLDTIIQSINDDVTYEILFEIRRIGTTNIITSATITFETFGSP